MYISDKSLFNTIPVELQAHNLLSKPISSASSRSHCVWLFNYQNISALNVVSPKFSLLCEHNVFQLRSVASLAYIQPHQASLWLLKTRAPIRRSPTSASINDSTPNPYSLLCAFVVCAECHPNFYLTKIFAQRRIEWICFKTELLTY